MAFRRFVEPVLRITGAAVLTTTIILAGITIAFRGQTSQQQQVADTLVRTNQAIACELALPVTDTGRDPALVSLCFTQYDLQPPLTQNP